MATNGIHRLTARQVLAADRDLNDGGGLVLRVDGERAKWVWRYTSPDGRRRELGLGVAYRDTLAQAGQSITDARQAARDAGDKLAAGIDPVEDRARGKAEAAAAAAAAAEAIALEEADKARQELTLARYARDYHARVVEPKRTAKHSAQWISSLENHLPTEVWDAPIGSVTAQDLLRALVAIKPHGRARNLKGESVPETVRRIRQRLESIFEDAAFYGHCTGNPAAIIRRKLREQGPQRTAGKLAALPYAEAPTFMAKLRTMPGTAARALEFAMLTCARTSEVLGLRWSEIDLSGSLWRCPAERMKAGADHVVHLVPRALEILAVQAGQDAELVFPSPVALPDGTGRELSNMAMLVTLDRMGYRDKTTVHGVCRATFSTWANETGAARPDVIEACLAHKESDRVRASYNRAAFETERRDLLTAWSAYLCSP